MLPIKDYIKAPSKIILGILTHFPFLFSDKMSLKIQYRIKLGRKLNLKNPQRFTEKLQWIKLYDRKPQYTTMVDKVTAKGYVASIIGDEYIIPTLGVWKHFDDIDFDTLPDKFVLKTNHSGGGGSGVIICYDKSNFDKENARRNLEYSLKHRVYPVSREWPYKNVKPLILAEQLLEDKGEHGLMDYKVFCCNGEPRMVKVNYDVATDYHVCWYDLDWNKIEGTTIYDPVDNSVSIEKPKELDQLLELARKLSKGISYLRVDFYCTGGKLKFGELTFFPGSGFERFVPDSFDEEIGSWIKLPTEILKVDEGGGNNQQVTFCRN